MNISEKEYKFFLNVISDPIYVVSENHVIVNANKAAILMLGLDPTGADCRKLAGIKGFICPWCIEDDFSFNEKKDADTALPAVNNGYGTSRILNINLKNKKLRMVFLNGDLREASLRKGDDQYFKKRKDRAYAADTIKNEYISDISHELRSPLNAILGFSEMLLAHKFGYLNEKQEKFIRFINDTGLHLLCLLNDILDISKIEAENMDLELERIEVKSFINESMLLIEETAAMSGAGICARFSHEIEGLYFLGDLKKMKRVMFNLLSNALKYTPGGGSISIHSARKGDTLEVKVKDTGIGLLPHESPHVFDKFYQAKNSYNKNIKGSGLGLSLTKKLIELHGGKIRVDSDGPGKGSVFTFALPVEKKLEFDNIYEILKKFETDQEIDDFIREIHSYHENIDEMFSLCVIYPKITTDKIRYSNLTDLIKEEIRNRDYMISNNKLCHYLLLPETSPHKAEMVLERIKDKIEKKLNDTLLNFHIVTSGEMDVGSKKLKNILTPPLILFIEDDRVCHEIVGKITHMRDIILVSAMNGKAGLSFFNAFDVDLVVTDIIMPEIEGIEVIKQVKKMKNDVGVVAVSGGGNIGPESYLTMAEHIGADMTISKPFNLEKLTNAVDNMLKLKTLIVG